MQHRSPLPTEDRANLARYVSACIEGAASALQAAQRAARAARLDGASEALAVAENAARRARVRARSAERRLARKEARGA